MRLRNIDEATLLQAFGPEAKEMIADYDCDFYMINNELASTMGFNPDFIADVAMRYSDIENAQVLTMVINYEAVVAKLSFLEQRHLPTVQHNLRAALIHESVHVKQIRDGRLVLNGNVVAWEGVDYQSNDCVGAAYYRTPWEVEAYIAQLTYQYGITSEEAIVMLEDTARKAA
ncbi:hypothetical protein D3C79_48800 [compost metagenome]